MPNTDAHQTWPRQTLLFICLVQLVLWTLSPTLSFLSPPIDVGENMIWGPGLAMGLLQTPAVAGMADPKSGSISVSAMSGVSNFMGQLWRHCHLCRALCPGSGLCR